GRDAGGHANPRHLFHRGPPALRAVRRQPVRVVRRDPVLVSQDVRPADERAVGQGAFLAHVHLLQLHLFPDAHHGDGWGDATALRPEPVHLLAALPAYPGVHLDQRVPAVRDADHLLREFLVEPQEGETGGPESVAGQRARVDAAESRAARQLGTGADGVPRAVRVQLAAGAGGLPAADPQAPGRPGAGRRRGRPLTTGEDDRAMTHAAATVDQMRPPYPAERGLDVYNTELGMWVLPGSALMFFAA